MTTTPLHQIPQIEDKVQLLRVEGKVKFAGRIEHGTSTRGFDWSKQFFVLKDGDAEVACTLWDAEGNEMLQDELVTISATQNKKGQWTGIQKGSYTDRKGAHVHSLEIRANSVKINGTPSKKGVAEGGPSPDDYPSPDQFDDDLGPRKTAAGDVDEEIEEQRKITLVREHLMRSTNLLNMSIDAVNKVNGPHLREIGLNEFVTPEFLEKCVATIFIESAGRRSDDGIKWWSYTDLLPPKPLKKKGEQK